MIKYTIASHQPSSHIFNVSLTFEPQSQGQQLILPCWIPGSYTIRDFARHVVQLKLSDACAAHYNITKVNSYTWQLDRVEASANLKLGPVTLEYEVYAWDRSVRGCHLDTTHAFINLSCLTLMVVGQESHIHQVQIEMPNLSGESNWTVATTLPTQEVTEAGFGWYSAKTYDELIDYPIEMGHIERVFFVANDIPHEIAITGQHYGDLERLKKDVQKIVETHQRLFNNHPTLSLPFNQYCFLLTLLGEGHGGLEHRSSTALISSRFSMPARLENTDVPRVYSKEYIELLGLFSHEYFHVWNVKCIKPAVFCPYDLTQPQYTRQLWAFEGITAYYDELALIRAGIINIQEYCQILSDTITKLKNTPGQMKQTLSDSSFDAWIKFYKPDENSVNSRVSYYIKGMLSALCFDMMLRNLTADEVSLDHVMRELWARYQEGRGVLEGDIDRLLYEKANHSEIMAQCVHQALYTTQELPLQETLALVGLQLDFEFNSDSSMVALGITVTEASQVLWIQTVLDNSAAMIAGLSAKDYLISIDSLKVNSLASLETMLMNYRPGDVISVHVFREDRLMNFQVTLLPALQNKAIIYIDEKATKVCVNRRHQWLKG